MQSLEEEAKAVPLLQMTADDCDLVLYAAQKTSQRDALSAVYKLMVGNLRSVIGREFYGLLDYQAVSDILFAAKSYYRVRHPHLLGACIMDIVDAIVAWARVDPIVRKEEWTQLLDHVDFTAEGISVEAMRDKVADASPLNASPKLLMLVAERCVMESKQIKENEEDLHTKETKFKSELRTNSDKKKKEFRREMDKVIDKSRRTSSMSKVRRYLEHSKAFVETL